MKTFIFLFSWLLLLGCSQNILAQTITYGIANKVVTSTSVSFDVTLSSTVDFKLGPGQVYLNYNSLAFGTNVQAGNRVTITRPTGSVLAQQVSIFDIYTTFTINDNTDSRFSFAWLQGFSSGSFSANITSTPAVLFRVTLDVVPGGQGIPDNVCFESGSIFDDQTFTACGPSGPGSADCINFPGIPLTNDIYNCDQTPLPVEIVSFDALLNSQEDVDLIWQTETELNNDYFIIEHATDDQDFQELLRVQGAGTYQGILDYKAIHENPPVGNNYYRLRQVDFDGTFTYSDIRQVKLDRPAQLETIQVFPNPTYGQLTIRFSDVLDQAGQIRIFNNLGQFVRAYPINQGLDQQQLNLSDLHKGIYLIEVMVAGQSATERVLLH